MIKTIQVSKRDIEDGLERDCFECPIARAITRQVKKGVVVRVGQFCFGSVDFHYNSYKTGIIYNSNMYLPVRAADWYTDFDSSSNFDRQNMNRIRFKLEIPDWALT